MPSQRTWRLDWASFRRGLGKDVRAIAGLALLFLGATGIEPYRTERPFEGESPIAVARDHMTLAERLGHAVVLRARYGEMTVPSYDPEFEAPVGSGDMLGRLSMSESHPDYRCSAPSVDLRGVHLQHLTLAIVAVERYNRGPSRRAFEERLAHAWYRLTGRLPAMSLGIAQIQPDAARPVVTEQLRGMVPPEGELLALLRDRCHNVRIARQLVRSLVDSAASNEPMDIVYEVAERYGGSGRVDGSNFWYFEAVRGAYELLAGHLIDSGGKGGFFEDPLAFEEEAGPSPRRLECIYFEAGSENAYPWSDRVSYSRGPDSATVYIHASQDGPPRYAARLDTLRIAQVTAELRSLGYDQRRIRIAGQAPDSIATTCVGESGAGTILLEIESSLGATLPER